MPDIQAIEGAAKRGPSLSTSSDMPEVKPAETKPDPVPAAPAQADEATPAADVPATDSQDTGDTATPDSGSETAANAEGKVPKGVQKRIDELTRKFNDERRAREAIEKRIAEEGQLRAAANEGVQDPEPDRKEFDDPDAYNASHVQWLARKALREERVRESQAIQQARVKDAFERTTNAWAQGREKAIEKYPDYADVAENDSLQIAQHVGFAIVAHAHGHDIAYYLGKHPDEASRLSSLSPLQAAIAVGEIGAKLSEPKATAPKPVTPLGSRSSAPKSLGDLSMDEYAKARNEALRGSRR